MGLGASGETYLVGPDFTMRNQSRFLIEDQKNYFKAIQALNIPKQTIDLIHSKQSSIGLQEVKTQGTQAAMDGHTAFDIFPDYRGVPVLSAYGPLKIPGLKWAIMSEIDEAEAFESVSALTHGIITSAIWVMASILLVVLPLGLLIGRRGAKSFEAIIETAQMAAKGDLTGRVQVSGKEGLGAMGTALNEMLDQFEKVVGEFRLAAQEVTVQSTQIRQGNDDLSGRTAQQASSLEETSASMEEMTSTVKQNATNAGKANRLALESCEIAQKGEFLFFLAASLLQQSQSRTKYFAGVFVPTRGDQLIDKLHEVFCQIHVLRWHACFPLAFASLGLELTLNSKFSTIGKNCQL